MTRCAENLVDACLKNDEGALFVFTRQIFGLCDAHGVADPVTLFDEYRVVVRSLMTLRSRSDVVGTLNALVWEPSQKNLADMFNVSRREWSSVLTTEVPPIFVPTRSPHPPRHS